MREKGFSSALRVTRALQRDRQSRERSWGGGAWLLLGSNSTSLEVVEVPASIVPYRSHALLGRPCLLCCCELLLEQGDRLLQLGYLSPIELPIRP